MPRGNFITLLGGAAAASPLSAHSHVPIAVVMDDPEANLLRIVKGLPVAFLTLARRPFETPQLGWVHAESPRRNIN
jgi:hypothetical protein